MKNSIFINTVTLLSLVGTISSAQEVQAEKKERIHSVRKVVDQVGKIAEKEVSEVDKVRKMFSDGKVSGQLRVMYSESPEPTRIYTTAVGGIIKYELAEYRGFNAGAAVYTSYDIPFASGEGNQRYIDLSSSEGNYADMSEAYVNYKYQNFDFRAGRQVLNTPLADSDDIRMIQNSFEAYVGTYAYEGVEFMVGNIQRWHGTDVGLDEGWVETGADGTNFAGVTYHDGLEFNLWYYNITELTNAAYFDIGFEYAINDDLSLHMVAQYLNEKELSQSGVAASIYGALTELVAYDVGFNFAFNKSDRRVGKSTFSGFGGGPLFTSMDTTIIDEIAQDRDVLATVIGITYRIDQFGFLYAYGDFSGGENGAGKKEHLIEQNMGTSYNFNEELVISILYSTLQDKLDDLNSWDRIQAMFNYNF